MIVTILSKHITQGVKLDRIEDYLKWVKHVLPVKPKHQHCSKFLQLIVGK